MQKFLIILLAVIFFSCSKKEKIIVPAEASVSYTVTITSQWKSPEFVVPAGAHFTNFIGMVHSADTFLWSNVPATPGLEFVAEVGSNWRLMNELDTIIARGKALSQFSIPPPVIGGAIQFPLNLSTQFSYISFASMVAPSPDWFTGLNHFSLLQDEQWMQDVTIDMFIHDAGSENGDIFGYDNPATIPAEPVHLLTAAQATVLANGNPTLAKIATIRFVKN